MPVILGIESSCDETAAALVKNGKLLANIVAGQEVHRQWGGVIPELASRAHQQHIVPVIDQTLKESKILPSEIDAVAFTRGPGLLGSLLVGTSFAKAFALALGKPLIEVNHMQAHILAHFIRKTEDGSGKTEPSFPFLCLTVSGGHTQLVRAEDPYTFRVLGETIDDAAGEAFDKTAKILGLPYPGGPLIDKNAVNGNADAFHFPEANIPGLNYSFSGLKTSVMYFVRDELKKDEKFLEKRMNDICASVQFTIIKTLLHKLEKAADAEGIKSIGLAGGVSANSGLRTALTVLGKKKNWNTFIPPFEYCTDNAAMIAMAGHFKFLKGEFADQSVSPLPRYHL
ncbi:MAG TPA: tRNA (adenosine(37)-N6)-threonylcarbamoyltransferase complex transferase subunit TsaD [Bacteroidia bacterium]|jgi:N6-L-threonylcarbamoyladenine synthase|nr:tRNA (adenosine(37)-N6)-threonylcarbamoyltransferase complex transferase subunit TsaD [Bacteroidia bacterium]